MSLLPDTIKQAGLLGDSVSSGIDKLFRKLPVLSKAKTVIELSLEHLPEEKRAIAESVLFELEDLEIEQAYEDARIEGTLPEPKTGAWIV